MNTNDLLSYLTQLFFFLLGLVTTFNYLRYGGETRRDIALMADSIAIASLVQILGRVMGLQPAWLGAIGSIVLLMQPYLLLRLAQYFHEIPSWIMVLALSSMVLAEILLVLVQRLSETAAFIFILIIIAYFVSVNGYAMIIFVRSAWVTSGVVQRRLRFAAAGSGLFALALFVIGLQVVVPVLQDWLTPLIFVAAIASAANFYVCFVPSRSLQQAWQFAELQGYLQGIGRKLIEKRLNVKDSLAELCTVTNLATGATATAVIQGSRTEKRWQIYHVSGQSALTDYDNVVGNGGILSQVQQTHTPAYIRISHSSLSPGDRQLLEMMNADTMLVAPIAAAEYDWGLLLVFLKRSSLFIEDDLRLVTLLTQQSAIFLENSALIEKMQDYSESLERQVEERTQEIQQMNMQLERRVAERTADLSRANAELGQVVRAKDEFLANMSHELRTPLNGILILSEVLLEQIRGPINERQAKSLQTIYDSGHHLLSLINDILDLSKIEAGELDLQLRNVLVEEICNTSLQFVKEQAHQKQIRLTFQSADLQTKMEADPRRLKQILINLLSNAVKFTPQGGQVTLKMLTNSAKDTIRLLVEDTGIGISAEGMTRLFKPFSQLDSSLTREQGGTGLGLALVSRLVEVHGGSVQVESEGIPGKGSRFTVSLPRHRLSASSGLSNDTSAPPLERALYRLSSEGQKGIKALIIEDSPTAVEQVKRYLQELSIQIVAHSPSETAIQNVLMYLPDFIILDLLLPGQSGWEILAKLKSHPRLQSIPVLIVSVVDEPVKGLAAGATEYLVKPITRTQFRRALRRVVGTLEEAEPTGIARPASVPERLPEKHGPLILLAEDNETNIQAIGEYLEDINYRVMVARNGSEALDLALEQKPDLILMDIQMPVLDGFTATQRLRAMSEFDTTPIVALTALAMPGDRERCMAAGVNEYLAKPISLKKLTGIMDRLLPEQN